MSENLEQESPPEQPQVVQVIYQVSAEDAPLPPEKLSVLEGRTGLVVIILLVLWGLVWYNLSVKPDTTLDPPMDAPISADGF